MSGRAGRFLASVAHTSPRQLVQRARLLAKRRALVVAAGILDLPRRVHGEGGPALAEDLPPPLFPARAGLARRDARGWSARFVGVEASVAPPVVWRPSSWMRGTRLELLNLHYMEWLEALDDPAFVAAIDDWIARVPPYAPGYWLDAWNSYALSIRVVVWLQQLAARHARLDPGFVVRCSRSVVAQVRFLARNLETDIRGNHIVRNAKALLWAARSFRGPEAERWHRLGLRILGGELPVQVLPDGVHFERSPAYHAQVAADLLECAAVAGPNEGLERALDGMARALADLTHPDGKVSLFNDGGLDMAYAPGLILDRYASRRGSRPSPSPVVALRSAGFYGARSGGEFVLAKFGRIGDDGLPAHAHGDALAFEWSVGGARLVVDAGVFEYHAGPMRDWSRATRAHNTVTVDDADQAEFYGAFRVGRRPSVVCETYEPSTLGFSVSGSHDGFRALPGAPIHRRLLSASPSRIEIDDRVDGGAGQRVVARLLLHPETQVSIGAGETALRLRDVRARLTTAHPVTIQEAWWCPDFGVRHRAPQLAIDYGAAPAAGRFVLEKLP